MKIKIQKAKFIRNIIIGVVALIIAEFIVNIAPGYKRNKYSNIANLVIGDENVTEKLENPIYIDEEKGIYISKEDILNLFDKTLYYDEENNTIITTSNVAVASIKIGDNKININNATKDTLYTVIQKNNVIYIPIEELKSVYNIDVQYIEENNTIVIDRLNDGMIKAEAEKNTEIRFKPRGLSKKVGKLEIGDSVVAFYTTSKGWRLIRTKDGTVGYVKANVLTNEYIVRQDMDQEIETKEINISVANNTSLDVEGSKILIKDLLILKNDELLIKNGFVNDSEKENIWANLSLTNANLESFENRTKLIKSIVTLAIKNNLKGINIIPNNNENVKRFTIELAPRLREIGIETNIVTEEHKEINKDEYIGIVNYIITSVK